MENSFRLNVVITDRGVREVHIIGLPGKPQRKGERLYHLINPKLQETHSLILQKYQKDNQKGLVKRV